MRRFHFSLQALQTLLEQKEQAALLRYLRLVSATKRLQQQVQEIRSRLATLCGDLRVRLDSGCPAIELNRLQDYCQSVKQSLAGREKELQGSRKQCESAMNSLLAARKSNAVVRRYHELQKERYDRVCQKHEQKFLDELGQHPLEFAEPALTMEEIKN